MSDVVGLGELRAMADTAAASSTNMTPLRAVDLALIELGLAVSVTSLNRGAFRSALASAYGQGVTTAEVQEIISLVSGLGVHSLMISTADIWATRPQDGGPNPLTVEQSALWQKYVAGNRFWEKFEREMPGFLESMLRLSADQFVGFFEYCSIPWKTQAVPAVLKELIAMATDATPAHRFLPGFRLHLGNALKLGASREAIMQALNLAENAPPHNGAR